jgi:hypothetical protein
MLRALFILLLLGGCGSSQREALRAYREAFALGEFDKAQELLKKAELEKEPRSKLLLLMERGRLRYAEKKFKEAAADFTAAIELTDAQYTKSVTRESSKWIINDASGEFFGAPYERSWLYYHQALAYFRLYQEGNLAAEEARRALFSARAALLAWDSFFQDWQRSTDGKTLYRHDLTAKLIAAEVHEATGVRADLQIALQLYKDGWKILTTLVPAYDAFNSEAGVYAGLLEKALNDDGEFKVPSKHRTHTAIATTTRHFILGKIKDLTQRLRPAELAELPKQLGVTTEELKSQEKTAGTVAFVLEEGVLPPKTAESINLGIKGLAALSKDAKTSAEIARVGSEVLAAFAVNMLDMGPRKVSEVGRFTATHNLMTVAAHEAAIEFEIPLIPKGAIPQALWLVARDDKGKEVARAPWNVVTNLEDVARQNLEEESSQRILRTGVRVAMKHITAILASMALYKSLNKDGKNDLIAKYAAVGAYIAATKGIAYSERADVRAWLTLPRTLRLVEMELKPGKYQVELAKLSEQNTLATVKALGEVTVKSQRAIFTYLLPQL